jgi:3-phenylpropionate/cinnamic acid dioxygenase small subunit
MMNDDRAIENLLMRYAELIDSGDFEGVATLLKDCLMCSPVDKQGSRGYQSVLDTFRQSTRLYPDTGTPKTRHVVTNANIEIDSSRSRGLSRSYYTVFQGTEVLPLQPIVAGRYHDEFVREDEEWRFDKRLIIVDIMGDVSQHLLIDVPS